MVSATDCYFLVTSKSIIRSFDDVVSIMFINRNIECGKEESPDFSLTSDHLNNILFPLTFPDCMNPVEDL